MVVEIGRTMQERIVESFAGIDDPAQKLATGLRILVRLAHDDQAMGRFIVRFALTEESLRAVLTGPPIRDVREGIAAGRYSIDESMVLSAASLMIGATVNAMWMVLDGHQAWREAGTSAAWLVLRALGLDAAEADRLANTELPPLLPPGLDR